MSNTRTVVRPDPITGAPDDIVVDCETMHLERMDDNFWWLGCYRDNKRITFYINQTETGIEVTVVEDDLGAIDDTKK